jgi:hypothetical protein
MGTNDVSKMCKRQRNKGRIKVSADKNGNNLGAKKGKTYARNVNTVMTILPKNIALLNQDSLFIFSSHEDAKALS